MKRRLTNILIDIVLLLIAVLAGVIVSRYVIFRASVFGSSMEPTYYQGDTCFAWVQEVPERGDIVIVETYETNEKYLIKRVIGIPGDTVQIINGVVYLNSEPLEEEYVVYKGVVSSGESELITLGMNEYYVLGDNREVSRDSRIFGAVDRSQILGVVIE